MNRRSTSLLILVVVVSLALFDALWNQPTEPSATELLAPNVVAAGVQDQVATQTTGALPSGVLAPVALAPPDQSRADASAPTDATPSADPEFDLAELAVPNVIVTDANTDRPLAGIECEVTDAGGVTLFAKTDSKGRLVTDELLLTGPVALSVAGEDSASELRARQRLALLEEVGQGAFITGSLLPQAIGRFVHTGTADRWPVCRKRWVPLEVAGIGVKERDVHLAFPFKEPEFPWDAFSARAVALSVTGYDPSVMKVSSDAFPMAFESQYSWPVSGRDADVRPHQWARQRADEPVPGRVLRAVQFLRDGVVCAEADANVLPHLFEWPLRLEFAPLLERDAALIRERYGADLGARIMHRLGIRDTAVRVNDRALGTVTSESGTFRGRIIVTAWKVSESSAGVFGHGQVVDSVRWDEDASGDWVGVFALKGLDSNRYRVELSTETFEIIAPHSAEITPADGPHVGAFVVRDQLEYVPVVLRLRHPPGGPKNNSFAEFKPVHGGNNAPKGGFFSALPAAGAGSIGEGEGHTLAERFPREGEFRVAVQTNGYAPMQLTQEDFHWDGERLVYDSVLQLKVD